MVINVWKGLVCMVYYIEVHSQVTNLSYSMSWVCVTVTVLDSHVLLVDIFLPVLIVITISVKANCTFWCICFHNKIGIVQKKHMEWNSHVELL